MLDIHSETSQNELFISYSRRDNAVAQQLIEGLKMQGLDPWFDMDDIPQGAKWWEQIKQGILSAQSFVFLVSSHSLRSEVCNWELHYAFELNKRIIPVMLEDVFADKELMSVVNTLTWTRPEALTVLASDNWKFIREINFVPLDSDPDQTVRQLIEVARTDLQYLEAHTRLLRRAVQWDNRERHRSFFLSGIEVEEAEDWLTDGLHKRPVPMDLQVDYIRQSRRAQRRTQRNVLASVSFALIIVSGLAVLAFFLFQQSQNNLDTSNVRGTEAALERDRANTGATEVANERDFSESLRLSGEAEEADDPETATLLAIRAMNASYTQEAETALMLGLERLGSRRVVQVNERINAVAFSEDSSLVVIGTGDGEIILWTLTIEDNGELGMTERWRIGAYPQTVQMVAISPDHRYIASVGIVEAIEDNILARFDVWETATGELVAQLDDSGYSYSSFGPFWYVGFISDGSLLTADGSTIKTWSIPDGEVIEQYFASNTYTGLAMDEGEFVVAVADDIFDENFLYKTIQLFNMDNEEALQESRLTDVTGGLALLDKIAIVGDENGSIYWLDFLAEDDPGLVSWIKDGFSLPYEVDFNASGQSIHTSAVEVISVSNDRRYILTTESNGTTILWDVNSRSPIRNVSNGGDTPIVNTHFSANSPHVITIETDGTMRAWDFVPEFFTVYACTQVSRDLHEAQFDFRTTDSEWRLYNISDQSPTCPKFEAPSS
ncbi:MAG: TIR domain-containing protein [Chloroflexi bacterium]|nr:TIR domain-containing protein [Chloroflexota bacterium]